MWSVNIRRGRAVRTVLRRLLAVWPIVSCWRWGASGLQRVKRPEVWSTQRASATPKRWAMAPRDSAPRPVRRSPVHAVQYPVASYAIRIERYDVRWAKFLRYAIRIERYDVRRGKVLARARTSGLVSFGRLRASPRSRARYDSSPFRSAAAARTVRPATTSPRRTVRGGDAKRACACPCRRRPRRACRDPSAVHLGRWVSGDGAANDETRDAMSIHSLYGAGANTFRTHTPDGLPQTSLAREDSVHLARGAHEAR